MDQKTFSALETYMISCMMDSAHDKDHVYRVLYGALEIAKTEQNVQYDVLIAACLLHDIGRKEQNEDPTCCHAQVGAEKAYEYLLSHGFSEDTANHVRQCIQTHRYRKGNPPQSIEAKILFDADKLDVTGALGVARTLLYNGMAGELIYTLLPDGTIANGEDRNEPSFFQEYQYKLKKIYEKFYTARGKEMARERKESAEQFYQALLTESRSLYRQGKTELSQRIGQ